MRCVVIFIPLSLHLLPIHDFSFGYGFCLAQLLISPFALGIALLHRLYSSFVKDVDYSTAYAVVQLFGAKALPCTLKSEMLKSKTVRRVWRTNFCWLRLPAIFRPRSLPIMVISRCENLFLPMSVK